MVDPFKSLLFLGLFKRLKVLGPLALALALASCASSPKLKLSPLPRQYETDSIKRLALKQNPSILILRLDQDKVVLKQVLELIQDNALASISKIYHPHALIEPDLAQRTAFFLKHRIEFYFAALIKGKSEAWPLAVLEVLKGCRPLSSLELGFWMHANQPRPFSMLGVDLMIIAGHELLIRMGAKPLYPKVYSPSLRLSLALPKLDKPWQQNLIKPGQQTGKARQGFIICHRQPKQDSAL